MTSGIPPKKVRSLDTTEMHILSEFNKLAQIEHKKRHNKMATLIPWALCMSFHPSENGMIISWACLGK